MVENYQYYGSLFPWGSRGDEGAAGAGCTGLQPAVRNAPVPDIIDNDLVTFVQYLVYHTVLTDTNPKQVLCTGELVRIMRDRLRCQVFSVLKNVRNNLFGDFPEILFCALFDGDRKRIHDRGSHHAFFELGKADRTFVPPLGNHCEVVEVFPEMLVFADGEDHRDLVAVLVHDILLRSCQNRFLILRYIFLMI